MLRVIGFQAVGKESNGDSYECSFMVSFPVNMSVDKNEFERFMSRTMTQFKEYHPTGQILSKVEKVMMGFRR